MNLNYEEVPNILTNKDLDYLSDMFDWNLQVVKCAYNAKEKVKHQEIKDFLDEVQTTHQNILNNIINIIKEGDQYEQSNN